MFRDLDIFTVKLATSDLPEECRFVLHTQLMILKKEEEPTANIFATLGDTSQDPHVDNTKVRPIQM